MSSLLRHLTILIVALCALAAMACSDDTPASTANPSAGALSTTQPEISSRSPATMEPTANMVVRPQDNWGQTDPQKISQNMRDLILRTQKLLSASGYDVGRPDGVFGPRTREAITAFQTDIGMPASGRVDTKLLAALEARAI